MTATPTALLAGHTGLVGRQLLTQLLREGHYGRVLTVGRRLPDHTHPRLQSIKTELGELSGRGTALAADDVYCCLGTTMRAAGSRAAFERVDYHMVVDLARATRAAGAKRFFMVSSLSASARSPVFYSRVKGRAEQAVSEIGFETLHILRPSLLLGQRTERRIGEAIAQSMAPLANRLLMGRLAMYRAVRGEDVATAMVQLSAREALRGTHVWTLPLPSP
ncbi:MAG: NAD-dependent epimerase/dehydratase family protein [Panacagrimonas sp.]